MKTIILEDFEVKQLLFELNSALEIVENDIQEFSGDDEIIRGIISKLEWPA